MKHQDRTARPASTKATDASTRVAVPDHGMTSASVAATAALIEDSPYVATQRRRIADAFGPSAEIEATSPIQRRIAVKRTDGEVLTEENPIEGSALALHGAIVANEQFLLGLECEKPSEGQTPEELERAKAVLSRLKDDSSLRELLQKMRSSDVDFGTIDLRDPQHLAQFYFDARRELAIDGAIDVGPERTGKLQEGRSEDESDGKRRHGESHDTKGLPESANTYPVAILGAGASVAYYLATAGRSLDPQSTVIIGETQPWAEERGSEGVVNHPLNMIAPDGYQGPDLLDAEGGLAPRRTLSERIQAVLDRWPNVKTLKINQVTRDASGDFFTITTAADGPFYARRVIAGLGIGKHKEPDKVSWAGDDREHPDNKVGSHQQVPRMIDMDRFQRAMVNGELPLGSIRSIAVVGPNAAIDVMSTVLRRYPGLMVNPIYWITGTEPRGPATKRPAFLKGTDNEYVEARYDAVMKGEQPSPGKRIFQEGVITVVGHDYLAARVGADGVALDIGERGEGAKPEQRVDTLQADLVVYGMGPDVGAVSRMFGISERALDGEMEPIYDMGLHFNEDAGIDSPESLSEYLRPFEPNDGKREALALGVFALLAGTEGKRPDKKDPLGRNGRPPVVGVRLAPHDTGKASLEVIGGTAYRFAFAGRMRYRYLSRALERVRGEELVSVQRDRDGLGHEQALFEDLDEYVGRLERYLEVATGLARKLEAASDTAVAAKEAYWRESSAGWLQLIGNRLRMAERSATGEEAQQKILRHMRGTYALLEGLQRQLEGFHDDAMKDKYASLASSNMSVVPNSLPKNVVLGDQLTAARSSVEALQSHVPPDVSRGVNLVTSDQTTIAAYLATAHAEMPPGVANLLTARVVIDRRHAALDRAPLPRPELEDNRYSDFHLKQQSAFQAQWMGIFEQVNALFKRDRH